MACARPRRRGARCRARPAPRRGAFVDCAATRHGRPNSSTGHLAPVARRCRRRRRGARQLGTVGDGRHAVRHLAMPEAINASLVIERLGPEPGPGRLDRLVGPRMRSSRPPSSSGSRRRPSTPGFAIERLGPEPGPGRLDRLVGPRGLGGGRTHRVPSGGGGIRPARRVVHLRPSPASGVRRRAIGGVAQARRSRGRTQRRVRWIGGGAALGSVRLIVGQVSPIDAERSIVRLSADRTVVRRTTAGTAGVTSAGALTTAVVVAAPTAAVAIPGLAVAGAISIDSTVRPRCGELGRLLDQIVRVRPPPVGPGSGPETTARELGRPAVSRGRAGTARVVGAAVGLVVPGCAVDPGPTVETGRLVSDRG